MVKSVVSKGVAGTLLVGGGAQRDQRAPGPLAASGDTLGPPPGAVGAQPAGSGGREGGGPPTKSFLARDSGNSTKAGKPDPECGKQDKIPQIGPREDFQEVKSETLETETRPSLSWDVTTKAELLPWVPRPVTSPTGRPDTSRPPAPAPRGWRVGQDPGGGLPRDPAGTGCPARRTPGPPGADAAGGGPCTPAPSSATGPAAGKRRDS